ncbi:VWA domain-containing protein [Chthonobacter albigriseus]|uniref:VWA domain-containing protein n=1 Tax=Chthonobacter albigriseus TaxID=1683161 RepID=UPI0015EF522D|nr:VWA domain-containing protein [Chthonobacter albigriseus]
MISLGGIALLRPLWILALAAVAAVVILVKARGALGDWRRAVDAPLLAALLKRGGASLEALNRARLPASAIAAGILALALTGPATERGDLGAWRNLDAVLVGLDLSRSVAESALGEARLAALQAAEAAGTRQSGFIVYAGDAYTGATFTFDREALSQLIAATGPDLVPDVGSDPARAIALAGTMLAESGIASGDLVLVTDGGGIDQRALDRAAELRAAGHRLDVAFITAGQRSPDAPAPDRTAVDALASAGGGAVADASDPEAIPRLIAGSSSERLGRSAYAVLAWFDIGRPLSALAAVPLLLLFRRRR